LGATITSAVDHPNSGCK